MQIDIDWRDIFGECSLQMQKANTKRKWREIQNWQDRQLSLKLNKMSWMEMSGRLKGTENQPQA